MGFLAQLVQVFCLVALVTSCSPPQNWKSQTMVQRAIKSTVLVYGEVTEITSSETDRYYKDVEYKIDVHCVLRNEANPRISVGGSISVFEHDPPHECVSNKHAMEEGKKVILMLEGDHNDNTKLKFDNLNVQGAVFEGNEENLYTLAQTCEFKRMAAPGDAAKKQCPADAQRDACANTISNTMMSAATCCYRSKLAAVLLVIPFAVIKRWW